MPKTSTNYKPQNSQTKSAKEELVGVDVFFHWKERDPVEFGKKLKTFSGDGPKFTSLNNRDVKVYPHGYVASQGK